MTSNGKAIAFGCFLHFSHFCTPRGVGTFESCLVPIDYAAWDTDGGLTSRRHGAAEQTHGTNVSRCRQWHHKRMMLEAATGGDEWMTLRHPPPPINQEMCALLILVDPCWSLVGQGSFRLWMYPLRSRVFLLAVLHPVNLQLLWAWFGPVRDWGLVMVWSKAMPLWCWIAAIPHCQV